MTFVQRKEEIKKFRFSLLEFQCEPFWIGKQFLMNYVTRQYIFQEGAFAPYCWEINVLPRFSSDIGMKQSHRVELCTAFNGLFHGNHDLIQILWIRHRTLSLLGAPRRIVPFLWSFQVLYPHIVQTDSSRQRKNGFTAVQHVGY